MAMWDPWRGCHKVSDGCSNCYTHKGDSKRGVDTSKVVKTSKFYEPIEKLQNGTYKMKSGSTVYICFSSDFLLEEADEWRQECYKMMKERSDLFFVFLTKRIERFKEALPPDWGDGYENVLVGCTVENQVAVDKRLPLFKAFPIKHKNIILQPLLEPVNIEDYLVQGMTVVVGGEYGQRAREFHYEWALDIREQCIRSNVSFELRQLGTYFVKNNVNYKLKYKDLSTQAKKANVNYYVNEPNKA